jgi:hypothetical protein
MPLEKFKDVTINGRDFRIGLVTALTGNWIMQVALAEYSNPEVYARVQNHLFGVCSVYSETGGVRLPMKIYESGRWLVPDLNLEFDTDTVEQLFNVAFDFNLGPTLQRRLRERLAALQTERSNAQTQDSTL